MKRKIVALALALTTALTPMSANAQQIQNPKTETENLAKKNVSKLYYGYISAIYATDNPDMLELEIQAYITTNDGAPYFEEYIAYSFGDDWLVNDNVLIVVNTNGTPENRNDNIVRDVIYVNPDFENGNQN